MYFSTRTTFSGWSNHPPAWVIGQVRRLADEFGYHGINAKDGQSNERVLAKGYLRLKWPTRQLAKRYEEAVEEMYGDRTSTRRFKNPRPLKKRQRD